MGDPLVSSLTIDGVSTDSGSEVSSNIYHRRPPRCLISAVRTYNISGRKKWVKWFMLTMYITFVSMEWFINLYQRYRALTPSSIKWWANWLTNWNLSCHLCHLTRAEHWQLWLKNQQAALFCLAILSFVNVLRPCLFIHLDGIFAHRGHKKSSINTNTPNVSISTVVLDLI